MNNTTTVKFGEKVGYSLGDTASNLLWQTFSMFILYFYTDVFGITGAAAGTMFLITRIWDSINDPLMGIIADRTTTKWGKFRPFLLWLAIPFGVIAWLTFTTPNFASSGKMVYAYVTYTFMMMIYTAINIPYSALMGVISSNSLVRTTLSSFRFVAAFSGGIIIQSSALKLVKIFGGENEQLGWSAAMAVYGGLAAILFLITFLTTKERVQPPKEQVTSLKNDLKDLVKNFQWWLLVVLGIFLIFYVTIRNGSIIYYYKYFVNDQQVILFGKTFTWTSEVLASTFMVVGSIANIVGVLFTGILSKAFGKKYSFIGLMILTTVFTSAFYIIPKDAVIIQFTFQILISFVMGPLSPIIWSMYTDVADYSEYINGRRATGLVMSASTMAQKFGWTIGGTTAGWVLSSIGYVPNIEQSAEAINGLRLMMSFYPSIGTLVCAIAMFMYKLNDKFLIEIEKELLSRKAND